MCLAIDFIRIMVVWAIHKQKHDAIQHYTVAGAF